MRRRTPLAAGLTTLAASLITAISAPPAIAAHCYHGACFNYVSGSQNVSGTGAQITMTVGGPEVDTRDYNSHTLMELAVQNGSYSNVEVGWMVDRRTFGDTRPHLFVYHWVNGKTSCYNGCGWRPVGGGVQAGQALTPGGYMTVGISNHGGDWWISYNGQWIGSFPGSLWSNTFPSFNRVQAFGEVASTSGTTCSDMGTGRWGSQSGAYISNFTLEGANARPYLTVGSTDPSLYNQGASTGTSFTLGGPGYGTCT